MGDDFAEVARVAEAARRRERSTQFVFRRLFPRGNGSIYSSRGWGYATGMLSIGYYLDSVKTLKGMIRPEYPNAGIP